MNHGASAEQIYTIECLSRWEMKITLILLAARVKNLQGKIKKHFLSQGPKSGRTSFILLRAPTLEACRPHPGRGAPTLEACRRHPGSGSVSHLGGTCHQWSGASGQSKYKVWVSASGSPSLYQDMDLRRGERTFPFAFKPFLQEYGVVVIRRLWNPGFMPP